MYSGKDLFASLNNIEKPGNPCKYWVFRLWLCLSVPEVYHVFKLNLMIWIIQWLLQEPIHLWMLFML